MTNKFLGVFFHWLPLAATIVLLTGFTYVAIQQNYRQSLNDPQIQMVEDAQAALLTGGVPADIVPRGVLFDAGKSLSPFIAVYDANGTPLEASAYIDNAPPKPPLGVFTHAKQFGENRVTWQPNSTTRIALVVRPVGGTSTFFVIAGRNMREVERRIDDLTNKTALALAVMLIFTFALDFISDAWRRKMMEKIRTSEMV